MSSRACKINSAGQAGSSLPVVLPGRAALSGRIAVAAEDDVQEPAPLELSHRVRACGEVVVDLGGELDIVGLDRRFPASRATCPAGS